MGGDSSIFEFDALQRDAVLCPIGDLAFQSLHVLYPRWYGRMDEHRYGEIALGKPKRDHRQMLTNSLLAFLISGLVAVNLNSTTISKKMEMMSCLLVTKTHTLIATSVYTLGMFVLSRRRLLSCRAKTDLPKYQREEEVTKFHCRPTKQIDREQTLARMSSTLS